MTAEEFRELALSLPGTEERSHMQHPDFRVGGKIFSTLGPDLSWGMLKLSPAEQQSFMRIDPAFKPASGKWGEGGATIVTLAEANEHNIHEGMLAAWKNIAPADLLNADA